MRNHKAIFSFALLCGIYATIFTLGCHKRQDNDPAPTTTTTTTTTIIGDTVTIQITGCNCVGSYSVFSFAGPGVPSLMTSIFWDFGDGGASSSANPRHLYNSPGTYTVNLSLNGKLYATKQFIVDVYQPGSVHTVQMAGMRHWKGTGSGMVHEFYLFPSGGTIDTQFAVTYVTAGIIRLPLVNSEGIILNITTEDTVNKVLSFKDCTNSSISLRYFYGVDSIVYTNYWSATVGHGYESLIMHSP